MYDDPEILPSLYHNGAVDPDRWEPDRGTYHNRTRPQVGDLVAWRYAAWRVQSVTPIEDYDLTDSQQKQLAGFKPEFRERHRPFHIVLRHHSGPVHIKPGETAGFKKLHDGSREVSFTSWPHRRAWPVLTDPYMTCSCHGHIWPCETRDQMVVAAHQAAQMDRLLITTTPGVCAACREPITDRQKSLTFPEPSLLVPGAPGPTFHAGRGDCWASAETYERNGRLVADPYLPRLASCPGIRFIHEAQHLTGAGRIDCTAGPDCTGHHGPAHRDRGGRSTNPPCWHKIQLVGNEGGYARPSFDCGYRGGPHGESCLGGDMSSGGTSISPTGADILWETRREAHRRQGHEPRLL